MRIAVFASGSGSNFEAVTKAAQNGEISAKIELLIVDKEGAYARERAKNLGVRELFVNPKEFQSKADYERALIEILEKNAIDLIVLAGYMRILSPVFVGHYKGRIVNIHPSLLPLYAGTHSIERAFDAGDDITGVTVHFVDEGVDTGEIIAQEVVEIKEGMSLYELEEAVHKTEHMIYPKAIETVIERMKK